MAYERQWRWILPVLLLVTAGHCYTATKSADMDSTDCDRIGAYTIGEFDIMHVYASPPQRPGGSATRDACTVQVRGEDPNRPLKIYIMDIRFNDCGTRMEIYDGLSHTVSPAFVLTCDDKQKAPYDTRENGITIRLLKQSPSALTYRINLVITTNPGPDIAFEQDMSNFYNPVISVGAIVGIAIAGGLFFVALLAIAIYCIVKQRKKHLDAEKAEPAEASVYTTGSSKVLFPPKKNRYPSNYESSNSDSHNSSYSSADGHNNHYVNMNPDPKVRQKKVQKKAGYDNTAYASSDDGGHDRSRDSTGTGTGSDDISAGQQNGSFDSTSDNPHSRRYSKNQENGSISRTGRRGSARSKSHKRKDSANDDKKGGSSHDKKGGSSRDGPRRSRSGSGHRSGHRDSGRRSRSHGERGGGSQRRSRSRSPHSQSSKHSDNSVFDNKGHNTRYDVSSMSKRSREDSNSSTSSRDSGDDRTVSLDPSGKRRDKGHTNRAMATEQDRYGSQV